MTTLFNTTGARDGEFTTTAGRKTTAPLVRDDRVEKLLTVNDVCAVTGLKRSTIYAMIHHERIPVIKISGRCVRFRESDIQAWLESKLVDAKPKEPKEKARRNDNILGGPASPNPSAKKTRGRGRVTKSFIDAIVEHAKREVLS